MKGLGDKQNVKVFGQKGAMHKSHDIGDVKLNRKGGVEEEE